jgi:hypothetical protein
VGEADDKVESHVVRVIKMWREREITDVCNVYYDAYEGP